MPSPAPGPSSGPSSGPPPDPPARAAGHRSGLRTRAVGERAVLVEVDETAAALALALWVRDRVCAEEVVPAARSVLLDGLAEPERLSVLLAEWPGPGEGPGPGEEVTVPVRYDGPDLADVAQRWGTDPDGVVERHTATGFVSAFCGFAPGFAYLAGLPAELAVPRLDSPRSRLEPGSVALADTWCGVYPSASPGGWRVIGHTDLAVWDLTRPAPALLAPGTRVRFEVAR